MRTRVNRGQEVVIGGYTRGTNTFDALVFVYYEGDKSHEDLREARETPLNAAACCAT
jgi:hypothetical protein